MARLIFFSIHNHPAGIRSGGTTLSLRITTPQWRSASASAKKMTTAARAITGPVVCRGEYSGQSMNMSFSWRWVVLRLLACNLSYHTHPRLLPLLRAGPTGPGLPNSERSAPSIYAICATRCAPHPRLCCVSILLYSALILPWHICIVPWSTIY